MEEEMAKQSPAKDGLIDRRTVLGTGAALAAVWDRNWEPVITAPVDAPMSWKNVLRVSMGSI